ncbi:autotransporter serine protease [Bordetella trematum]|nr:autotransporter serine protease [Bordetella trematum]
MPPRHSSPPFLRNPVPSLSRASLLLACLTLASCGGGGGGGGGAGGAGESGGGRAAPGGNLPERSDNADDRGDNKPKLPPGLAEPEPLAPPPAVPPAVPPAEPPAVPLPSGLPLQSRAWEQPLPQALMRYARPGRSRFDEPFHSSGLQPNYYNLIDFKPAKDAGLDGRGVTVAVIDSGVRDDVTLLKLPKQNKGDFQNGRHQPYDNSKQGEHGGWVSQVLAAQPDPANQHLGGIAPGVTLYAGNVSVKEEKDGIAINNVIAAWHYYYGRGARLFNNSFSTLSGTTSDRQMRLYQSAYDNAPNSDRTVLGALKHLINGGSLFIFAAGNGNAISGRGYSTPSAEGRTPELLPELQKGLIVVTAVDEFGQIERWADRCGPAAQWCMAAGSRAFVQSAELNEGRRDIIQELKSGTSFAAPQVTGAAALLLQKYPWMNNNALRTTLLTTAMDRGAAGVDAVYGWGVLDVGRALQGPARFAFGDFPATLGGAAGQRYVFGNDISGAGGLVVSGQATLTLAGQNRYRGRTVVRSGVLDVLGSITSPVHVEKNGMLTGIGSTGTVNNQGAVYSSGPGLRVNGDYAQSAQATLLTDIGSLMQVSGTATLDGRLHVQGIRAGYLTTTPRRHVFLRARQLQGRFATLTHSPTLLLEGGLSYTAETAGLDLKRVDTVAAVRRLGTPDARQAEVLAGAAQLEQVFERLDDGAPPDDAAAPQVLATRSRAGVLRREKLLTGATRLQAIRDPELLRRSLYSLTAPVYANAAALQTRDQDERLADLARTIADTEGPATAMARYQHGLLRWQPAGLRGTQRSDTLSLGVSAATAGQGRATLALTLSQSDWRETFRTPMADRSQGSLLGVMAGLRKPLGLGISLNTVAGAYYFRNRVTRQLWFGDEARPTGATAQGWGLQLGALLSREWQLGGGLALRPQAGLVLSHARQLGFQESGAWGYGLHSRGRSVTVPSLSLRINASQAFALAGSAWQWQAYVGLLQDLRRRDWRNPAAFDALPQAHGRSGQWNMARSRWSAGLDLRTELASGLSVGLGYQTQWSGDSRATQVEVALRYLF